MQEKIYHSYPKLSCCAKHEGFSVQENGSLILNASKAILIANTIWAESNDTKWQYLQIRAEQLWHIELYIWISNDQQQLEHLSTLSLRNQALWLKENSVLQVKGEHCFLFDENKIKGRFMKFLIVMKQPEKVSKNSVLYGYDVFYPLSSFVKYLPSCFDGNEERIRFLNDYQIAYELLEEEIEHYQYEMDVEYCSSEHLDALADWMDANEVNYMHDEKQKRLLLKNYIKLNSKKGTKAYYEDLLFYVFNNQMEIKVDKENDIMHIYGVMNSNDECLVVENFFKERVPLYMKCQFHWSKTTWQKNEYYLGYNMMLDNAEASNQKERTDNDDD